MTKKPCIKLLILLVLTLSLVYFGIYFIQNYKLKKSYVSYNKGQGDVTSMNVLSISNNETRIKLYSDHFFSDIFLDGINQGKALDWIKILNYGTPQQKAENPIIFK